MSRVLILADIEGSTGCFNKSDSQLFTEGWVKACIDMSKDINAIAKALIKANVKQIIVKDFHRTGYNLFPELITPEVKIVQGYFLKPIMGIGKTYKSNLLFMTGMHAASGAEGFLPHTLTSHFSSIKVNGQILTEAELFAASVYKERIAPVFLSGDSFACNQVKQRMPQIKTFNIDKPLNTTKEQIREKLASSALNSLQQKRTPFQMKGPFEVKITMRDREKVAEQKRKLWKKSGSGKHIEFKANSFMNLYEDLINIAYFHPLLKHNKEVSFKLFNIWGKITHLWARHKAHAYL